MNRAATLGSVTPAIEARLARAREEGSRRETAEKAMILLEWLDLALAILNDPAASADEKAEAASFADGVHAATGKP